MIPFWRENEKTRFNLDLQEIHFMSFEDRFEDRSSYSEDCLAKLVPYTPDDQAISLPFFLTVAGHVRVGSKHYTQRQGRLDYQCIHIMDGNMVIELENGDILKGKKGDTLILDCTPFHRYYTGDKNFWEYKHFHFCAPSGTLLPSHATGLLSGVPHINELFTQIFQAVDQNTPTSPYVISDAISSILTNIVLMHHKQLTKQPHQKQLEDAAEYLRENYHAQIDIDTIAKDMFLSRYYFIRLFKSYFGVSPYGYLTNYRITEAKKLLLLDYTVDEAAHLCGFGSANNLNRIFKKYVGMTPTSFKKNYEKHT